MFPLHHHHRALQTAAVLLASLVSASASAWQGPVGSAFTYQGSLKQNGQPVNGTADLQFTLFDAEAGGSQSSATLAFNGVQVTDGLFTVQLDFGPSAFTGDARWVQIDVASPSNGGVGPYAGLSPRQSLSATPYALFALHSKLGGSYGDQVSLTNPANVLSGDGSGLTNLNPAALGGGVANINILGNAVTATNADHAETAGTAGNVSGVVAVVNGGTGGNDASSARLNLEAAQRGANGDITSLSALTTAIAVFQGGTGASDPTTARTNLGAAKSGANGDITSLSGLTSALSVAQGGTGANNATTARTNLLAAGLNDANVFSRAQEVNLLSNEVGLSLRAAPGQSSNLQQWRNSSGTVVSSVSATGVFSGNGSGLVNLDATGMITGTLPNGRLGGTYANQLLLTNPNNFISGISQGITNLDANNLANGNMAMARMPVTGTWNIAGLAINGTSSTTSISSGIIDLNGTVQLDSTPVMPATARSIAIPPAAFTPASDAIAFTNSGTGLQGSAAAQTVTFIAPLNLPDGATITEIRAYVLDNDATQNATVAQLSRAMTSATPVTNGSAATTGNSATAQQIVIPAISGPIDNDVTTMWLSATWIVPGTPANMRLLGVRVTYTVTAPLP